MCWIVVVLWTALTSKFWEAVASANTPCNSTAPSIGTMLTSRLPNSGENLIVSVGEFSAENSDENLFW